MLIAALVLFQLLIFTGLVFVFRRIMTQNVVIATRHLEELNQNYSEKEKEADRRLEEAEVKSREMIEQSRLEADRLKTEILEHAEKERESIVTQARQHADEIIQQADKSRQQLLAELQQRIAQGAVEKACELLEQTLPEQFKQLVHTQWVEDLVSSHVLEAERLRIPSDIKEVKVVSAFELSAPQKKSLVKKLESALDREISIKEEIDPGVVAGIVIYIGELVLDGSLKNKIKEKARA